MSQKPKRVVGGLSPMIICAGGVDFQKLAKPREPPKLPKLPKPP